jgi:hypothetical protein
VIVTGMLDVSENSSYLIPQRFELSEKRGVKECQI